MEILRKYGVQADFYFPLIKAATTNFAVTADYTYAAGDIKISKDGGAAANPTNSPSFITMGNGAMVKLTLTATEMQAAKIAISIVDTATKAVEDQMILVATYGHASAEHAFDLDTATQSVAVASIATDAVDAAALKADAVTEIQSGLATSSALATVAGYVDTEVAAIKAKTDNLPASPAAVSDIPTVSAIADGVWNRLSSAVTTANSIGKQIKDALDAAVSSRMATFTYTAPDNTSITSIKAKTDNLPSDPADASDIAASFSTVNGTLATIAGYIDAEVAAIKAKTDNLPAAPAAVGDIPSASANASAVLAAALSEPAGTFAWGTATIGNVLAWLGALSRNKMEQTSSTSTLRNDADTVDIATASISNDGTTFTREEWG